jgi:hypothetical protein
MSHAEAEPVAVAVFARAPVPGFAKTRLIPVLGADGAAALQARLTAHAVATACAAAVGPVTLWATPDASHLSFRALSAQYAIALAPQPHGDIGARMLAAVVAAGGPVLVIGSDCPALTPDHLRTATVLLREGIDAVLLPADDGGYVLIGLRRPQPALFTHIAWSTEIVAAETRQRMARLGLSWREPARLWDLDRPKELARLQAAGFALS